MWQQPDNMNDTTDVNTLVAGLLSNSDSTRKYAVFRLQGLLSDPDFAEVFVKKDGLLALREAVMETTGNTQAYALGSMNKLLEVDSAWDVIDGLIIEQVSRTAFRLDLVCRRPGWKANG